MENKKYLYMFLAFVLSTGVGFGVTKFLVNSDSASTLTGSSVIAMNGGSIHDNNATSIDSKGEMDSDVAGDKLVTEDKAKLGERVETGTEQPEAVKSNPVLSQLEADAAARKAAEAAELKAAEAKARAEANRMSAAEFQSLIVNGDPSILGGKNPKVAKNISFSFSGIKPDDKKPGDIVSIRDKINYDKWTGITVSGLGYDAQGRINRATITPHYPEE